MTDLDKLSPELIDDAIRELKRLQLCPPELSPLPYQTATGIAGKSAVLFFCIDAPGQQSRHYIVKFDEELRASIEKSAHALFRDFRQETVMNLGFFDPVFERWISEHEHSSPNFCVYECAANFSDNRTFQTLRDYLVDNIRNAELCIAALELTLENLLSLNCSSPACHVLKDSYQGRALKLGDLSATISTDDYKYVNNAISHLTLTLDRESHVFLLKDLNTALSEKAFRETADRLCGRTMIGPAHGDMNSTNAVIATGTFSVPKHSLMIDLSHFDSGQPVLRDYAKLEVDLWMQVLPQLLPAEITSARKSLKLHDLFETLNAIYSVHPKKLSVGLESFKNLITFIRTFVLTYLPSTINAPDDIYITGSAMEFDIVKQYQSSIYFAAVRALFHLGKGGVDFHDDDELLRISIATFIASSSFQGANTRLPTDDVPSNSYQGPRIFVSPQSNTVDGFPALASKICALRVLGKEKINYSLVTTHECEYYERLRKLYIDQRVGLCAERLTSIISGHQCSLAAVAKAAAAVLFNTRLRDSCNSLRDSRRAAETISIMANFSRSNPIKKLDDPAMIEFRSEPGSSSELSTLVAISRQKLINVFRLTRENIATADVYKIATDKDIHQLVLPYLLLEVFQGEIPEDEITDEHFSLLNWYFKPY